MAVAFVQANIVESASVASLPVTFPSSVTAGNLIVAVVALDTARTVTLVSDNVNGSYTQVFQTTNSFGTPGDSHLWGGYLKNTGGGSTTVTAFFSGTANNCWLAVHEVSGCDTTSPLDQSVTNDQDAPGTGSDVITTTSRTTTGSGEYIFGVAFDYLFAGDGFSAGSSPNVFTQRARLQDFITEDFIQSSAGSIAATFTESLAPTRVLSGMMTFTPAPSAVGGAASPFVRIRRKNWPGDYLR
jgi:hypothetical protein